MINRGRLITTLVLALLLATVTFGTALDDYVKKADSSYKYSVAKAIDGPGFKAYVIDMISQTWRSKEEVDRTQWQHWLTVVVPELRVHKEVLEKAMTPELYATDKVNELIAKQGVPMRDAYKIVKGEIMGA